MFSFVETKVHNMHQLILTQGLQNSHVQLDELPMEFPNTYRHICVYALREYLHVKELKNNFMINLGVQSRVQGKEHHLSLIESTDCDRKCACGRNELYRCCEFSCKVVLCKKCFDKHPVETTEYIEEMIQGDISEESSLDSYDLVIP